MQAPYQSLKQRYLGFKNQLQKAAQLFAQSWRPETRNPLPEAVSSKDMNHEGHEIPRRRSSSGWVSFVVHALSDRGRIPKPDNGGVHYRPRRGDFGNGLWHQWAIL